MYKNYYALLLERVGRLAKERKSLDQIKKEVRMPEYENWATQERFPTNVEAAYRAVKGGGAASLSLLGLPEW